MRKGFSDPFSTSAGASNPEIGDVSPSENAVEEMSELPERGTGLKTGTAREEQGKGIPLTDKERSERHEKIKDPFITVSVDGIPFSRRETYHKEVLSSVPKSEEPKSRKQEWEDYYAKRRMG